MALNGRHEAPWQRIPVHEESGVGEARRAARRLAGEAGLGEADAERAAIVATEAARNALRHGRGGEVLVQGEPGRVDLVVLDRGPGIADLVAAQRDGHSTGGTPGHGLGAMKRLASAFDLWSAPGRGTVLHLAVAAAAPRAAHDPGAAELAAIVLAAPGESVAGDAWARAPGPGHGEDGGERLFLADGLGHGPRAHEAARACCDAFLGATAGAPADVLAEIHLAARHTRGAAGVVAAWRGDALRYAGAGNLSGAIVEDAVVRRCVSVAGTLGAELRKAQEFTYPFPPGALLVLHTDGIATQWSLGDYPGLLRRHPAVVAGVLVRDFLRGRDDAGVLVARRPA
jgi:anti-sigma regulatory factor (Ser/Thr protein kinase)